MHYWAHIGLAGSFGALLVGGCGARATVSIERLPTFFYVRPLSGKTNNYINMKIGNPRRTEVP